MNNRIRIYVFEEAQIQIAFLLHEMVYDLSNKSFIFYRYLLYVTYNSSSQNLSEMYLSPLSKRSEFRQNENTPWKKL